MSLPDIRLEGHGTIVLVRAHTPAGEEWLADHVAFEHFFGGAGVAEPRYANDIIRGAQQDGLQLQVQP